MKILPKFLVLIALMLPVGAENLPVLTLDDALSAAAENNITLKQAAITANQRIRNANNYIKDYLPTFGLSLSADTGVSFPSTSVEKTTFNGIRMDLSASASFSYTLSGSEITDGASRRLEKEAASLDYENSYSSLEDGITSAYWTLDTYDIAIENAKTSLEDMQDSYNSTLDMYNAGVTDELTLSNIELALNDAEIALTEAENNKALALASFKALTGIEEDFQTEPMPETVLLSLPTAEELFAEYAEGTWEIRNARNALMSAENSKKEATLNQYMPTVTANVGYTYQGGISSKANALTGLAAGQYGTNANNGISSRSGNGKQGGQTKVVHKRGSTTLGTYYVKGGFGGYGATTSAHGEAITNGTSSSQTTPNGTCYANGNIGCSYSSYSGESGTSTKGGNGGRVKNEGSITNGLASSGGYLYIDSTRTANQRATDEEIRLAKGQNATEPGFGGGGGLTPAWATGTSHFYQGGRGANGKVDITYKVSLPGGGGGSGARVGGYTSDNKMYEIKYKVKEGDRIVFKVGSGGSGGVSSQDGLNGSATVVGDNEIVFMAGEGGKTSTNDDKNNLRGGRGGYSSYINEEDIVQSNVTSGIKIKNTTNTTYTFKPSNNSFKGQNGKRGGVPSSSDIQSGYSLNNTIFNYGFSGGMGASPFGISQSKIGASITCGGGNIVSVSNIAMTLGQMTNINYLCTSGNIKGNDARSHDPVNNEFGGSGGGGGGVVDDSFELGSGGSGSSGYLRIRWDASEQE